MLPHFTVVGEEYKRPYEISYIIDMMDYRCCADTLTWLKTVPSTFQDVDFEGSLLPLFISRYCNRGIKKLPNH